LVFRLLQKNNLTLYFDFSKKIYYNIFVNKEEKSFMKKKELKNLAEKIAKCEYVVENSKDKAAVSAA